jgi:2'-hydroxyisoflavone reductase
MNLNRRQFIAASAGAAGMALTPRAMIAAVTDSPAAKPLRILILGGTGFLGPACTESALARGHHVTHFNGSSIFCA